MNWFRKMFSCLPKPDSWSLSFPPAINFPFSKDSPAQRFERLLTTAKWEKRFINDNEIWVCEEDALFQIDLSADSSEFAEPWTANFPDKTASKQPVRLLISSTPINELNFIWCDGGRYIVPIPKITGVVNGKQVFQWDKKSLGFKVLGVIGRYHSFVNIDEIAALCKIRFIDND